MSASAIRESLVTAMEHSPAPMVLSDPHQHDCPMIAVNKAFTDLCGYDRSELVGLNCRFLQGPNTDPTSRQRIRASLDAQQGCIEWIVNYRRDGSMFWNLLFISPVRDEDGNLLFYFGNQLDITGGTPDWLHEVSLGQAYVVPSLEREFHALLREVDVAGRVNALERVIAAAFRLAEISTSLSPMAREHERRA
jgi:PAS domain S-box-containing protein